MISTLIEKIGPRGLTPDVPEEDRLRLAANERFRKAAEDCARLRYAAMHQRQAQMARDLQSVEHKSVNGLGQHYLRVDRETYFQMRALFGEECWSDSEFIDAFHRDNPQCRVKTTRDTKGNELRK